MTSVWLTGSSRGIGRATALQLSQRGCQLTLLGRPSREQDETLGAIGRLGTAVAFVPCDLSDAAGTSEAAARALDEGTPDAIVHGAGIIERSAVHETTDESWQKQLQVNLSAPFQLTRRALPAMVSQGRGRIVFVSSISAVVGTARQAAYHAAKAGLLGLMRCLAVELSDSGVMTMAVLPGSVDTQMLAESHFAPRMSPDEVARTLCHYALDAGVGHNGAVIEMFGT